MAAGISLWSKHSGHGAVNISNTAIKLLEASPDPVAVLEAYAERVAPSSYSGSRANVMQPRADAIRELLDHESAEVAAAAKEVCEKLAKWIECERVREQREDEEHEQRFE